MPKRTIQLLFALTLITAIACPVVSQAATCDVVFSEEFNDSSINRFISAVREAKHRIDQEEYSRPVVVCLDSRGGNLGAARKFVEFMETQTEGWWQHGGIATVVANGMDCASSCALVFMAGFSCQKNQCRPDRSMEAFARLAFHSPEIPERDSTNANALVSRIVYQAAIQDLGYFVSLSSNPDFFGSALRFPGVLISEILSHHGDDFFVVDHLSDAITLDISLIGSWKHPSNYPDFSERLAIVSACDNTYWENQIQKGFPTEDYHYVSANSGAQDYGRLRLAKYLDDKTPIIYINKLLGSGNTAWAECGIHSVPDDGYGPYLDIHASLGGGNERSVGGLNFRLDSIEVDNEEISPLAAWNIVSQAVTTKNSFWFWPMSAELSEMGAGGNAQTK